MWGWTMPKERCFEILDVYYQAGFRRLDTATNYPINKQPSDFRHSEKILLEWINTHGIKDLQVIVKVGSINNLRSPEHNLSKSFLLMNLDDYRFKYDSNFSMSMVHWDNREDEPAIRDTLEAMDIARKAGLEIGLSGILHPEIYKNLNEGFNFDFYIQIKHNLLQSDYQRYFPFHGKPRFITYGMNGGGIKLDKAEYHTESSLKARGGNIENPHPIIAPLREVLAYANQHKNRPPLLTMNQLGMLYAYHSRDVVSLLIGPSKSSQLIDSLEFFEHLQNFEYAEIYQQLHTLTSQS